MNKNLFLMVIFFAVMTFTISAQSELNYYYTNGQKIYFTPIQHRYAIHFINSTPEEKQIFLSENKLLFDQKELISGCILVESTTLNEKEVKGLVNSPLVINVTNVYSAQGENTEFTISTRFIVKFKPNVSDAQISSMIKENHLIKIEKKWLGERTLLLSVNSTEENLALKKANYFHETGLVEFSHPDFITFNCLETNDTYYTSQWNLSKINATGAWNITTGSSLIIIAILDNGVDSDHNDLDDDLVSGYDVVDEDYTTDPHEDWYHGTAVAGIAAAETNNSEGIAGVGYDCKIMPIQITHTGTWVSSNLASGINWARQHGAHILNISGKVNEDDAVTNAINSATSSGRGGKGCVVVKSAGNEGEKGGEITFPGTLPNVIAVGKTDSNDQRRPKSSYGPALDAMAPSRVYTTDIHGSRGKTSTDYYSNFGCTSSAAPHVSGLAGLIISLEPNLTDEQVRKIICYTADDKGTSGWDQYYGWGRINAYYALRSANRQFTTSGTLSYNECWWGTITITGDVTVPSGKRLAILPGAEIKFNQNTRLYVKGTIIADGESGNKITLKSSQTSPGKSDWKGIKFTDNGGGIVRHCIIKDCDDPIRCYFTAPDSIAYCEIDHCHDGISFYKIYDPCYVVGNTIHNSDQRGIDISNSTKVELRQNIIYHNAYSGIKTYGSDFASNFKIIFNNVYDNNTSQSYYKAGIYAYNSTFYSVMDNNIYNNKKNGLRFYWYAGGEVRESSIYNNDIYEVYLSYDSYPYFTEGGCEGGNNEIICGYYGSGSPPSSSDWAIYHGPENLDYEIDAIGNYWGGDPSVAEDELFNQPDWVDYSDWLEKAVFNNPVAMYKQARKLFYEGQFEDSVNLLEQIIEDYPDSKITPIALRYLFYVVNATDGDLASLYNQLKEYVKSGHLKSSKAIYLAQDLAAQALWNMGYVDQAAIEYQDLLSSCKDDAFRAHIMLSLVACDLEMGDADFANDKSKQLQTEYPESEESKLVLEMLNDYQEGESPPVPPSQKIVPITIPVNFNFEPSYPNPFNPLTLIGFSVPKESHVLIKIYNVLGQKVATLVDENMPVGYHIARWDGRESSGKKASAGIYLCRMQAGDFVKTQKMTLLP